MARYIVSVKTNRDSFPEDFDELDAEQEFNDRLKDMSSCRISPDLLSTPPESIVIIDKDIMKTMTF